MAKKKEKKIGRKGGKKDIAGKKRLHKKKDGEILDIWLAWIRRSLSFSVLLFLILQS